MKLNRCGCGGEAEVEEMLIGINRVRRWQPHCNTCTANIDRRFYSEADAIKSWNRAHPVLTVEDMPEKVWMKYVDTRKLQYHPQWKEHLRDVEVELSNYGKEHLCNYLNERR